MPVEFPNIRHLRAFREVALCKGMSAAAERVHLSQPAVTQAIAGLERKLGLALFDRRIGGMFLTETGEVYFTRVVRLFEHLARGAREVAHLAGRRGGAASADFHNRVTAAQLRALVAIWETGNFSMAARGIGISQPSIHRAGRDLEKIAGTAFFSSSRKGVDLTPQAESFARAVKLAHAELRQAGDEITRLMGRDSTRIAVGSMPLSRSSILPAAMHALLTEASGVQLHSIDGPYPELLRGLRYGDLDFLIGALRDPAPAEDVVQEALFNDPLAVLVGPGHPLAGQTGLTLRDTLAYPWIAPPKTAPAGKYLFDHLGIGDMQATPVRIVSSSLVMVRGLLARGNYVTIMSLHQCATERAQGTMLPLDMALPDSARPIGLTFRADWTPTATQARFLDLIRQAAGKPGYIENE